MLEAGMQNLLQHPDCPTDQSAVSAKFFTGLDGALSDPLTTCPKYYLPKISGDDEHGDDDGDDDDEDATMMTTFVRQFFNL